MNNKQMYQKPESCVILIETEGDMSIIATSGIPSSTKTPSIGTTDSFFKGSENSILDSGE